MQRIHRILWFVCGAFILGTPQAGAQAADGPRHPSAGVAGIDQLMQSLDTRQKVAQIVVPWLPGSYAAFDAEALDKARMWVDSLQIGGLIISIGSPLDVAAKLNYLQGRSRLPLCNSSCRGELN